MRPDAPIAVTMGEPAGIGGEILLDAWQRRKKIDLAPFFLIGDPEWLSGIAAFRQDPVPLRTIDSSDDAVACFDDALPVLPLPLQKQVKPGHPSPANTDSVLGAIRHAVTLCQSGQASAVTTLPINKSVLYEGGFRHPGHTEYLGELAGVARTVMLLEGGGLRAVPVTIHQSLRSVPDSLTPEAIEETCRITDAALKRWFGLPAPTLAVAGLNPHAGEGGALGREEETVLQPALARLRADGIRIVGPLPADTMFHAEARRTYDVAICMYHDQALIPVKTLDFHGGVNITLGLPFIRTSPDHGTAFNLAGTGTARPDSLIAALKAAGRMAELDTERHAS
ncbi:4-hydroxythreonine-4-phosphate dehydrogenase PdxA [Rhodospirillaceae bacterium KN72]|uniref:4-hydroxythreonine-4-phosphate dehydrogenase n=1 Tax=Pacificispira spongiicola TaxID=2729598 RepID=A0A7Y0E2Y9_9PROT|nr:4-hydroxythreonine-4-phosphate dehydrogenase PdxA [Pacificispira spongiicola]NMM46292.1 4-hydroxythreonine-4-phosphate dehydrogenase PdxA [Pacificispira spongiicola]